MPLTLRRRRRKVGLRSRAGRVPAHAQATRRVLVATDGSRVAGAAIRFARLMAERDAWAPDAVAIFEPLPVSVADMTIGPPSPTYQQAVADSMHELIRVQLSRSGGGAWQLLTEYGRAAPSIVRAAAEQSAELIVLGLGRHGKLARWLGAETAARVARRSSVPVLAVANQGARLLRTALVAIDFGESSIRAAREAKALLPPGGRLHLVHVRWAMNGHTGREDQWDRTYDLGVERAFQGLVAELDGAEITVTTELRMGAVIEETLKAARKIGADLIALGSHNQNLVDRMVIGYTPGAMLRAAHCSVLIAPPTVGAPAP